MAFTPETFVICSKFPLFRASCNLWLYTTSDSLEDCLVENYFQPRMNTKNQDSPEVGDIIQCIVGSGTLAYLTITAKTEKPYNITVEKTYLENEAEIYEAIYLAADKGEQLYQTGVWYAKMYSDTVVPTGSEYEDRNYADFSQVDSDNNPIIVIYECQSGVWVEIQRITPPTEYNGYLPITSKFWDIEEQTGQQGGEVLWSFNTKRFTPFPRIISYDSIHITGDSTVEIPDDPSSTQIVNKDYVDTAISLIPIPTVDIPQSVDAEIVGTLTQNGNGFSGFTQNNYLSTPANTYLTSPFEIVIGATFASGTMRQMIFSRQINYNGGILLYYNGGTSELVLNAVVGVVVISGVVLTDTPYLIKVSWDGSDYKMFVSTDDGDTYTQLGSTVASNTHCGYGLIEFGHTETAGTWEDFLGTIDLTRAYIKVGENIVWAGVASAGLGLRVAKGHEVIEFQKPTAQNNYTWFRLYADGWVEQGGFSAKNSTVNLPVTMSNTNYVCLITSNDTSSSYYSYGVSATDKTTASFYVKTESTSSAQSGWIVMGMAA